MTKIIITIALIYSTTGFAAETCSTELKRLEPSRLEQGKLENLVLRNKKAIQSRLKIMNKDNCRDSFRFRTDWNRNVPEGSVAECSGNKRIYNINKDMIEEFEGYTDVKFINRITIDS